MSNRRKPQRAQTLIFFSRSISGADSATAAFKRLGTQRFKGFVHTCTKPVGPVRPWGWSVASPLFVAGSAQIGRVQ